MVDWNALYAQQRTPWEDGIPWRPLAGMVGALVPAGGRVLDLGCGLGTQAMHLAATGYQVAGVDLAEEAITRARRAAASRGLEVDWRTGDFYRLDLGPPFALVFDRSVFANASDHGERTRFAARVAALLARDGWWLNVSGCADNRAPDGGVDPRGYPRLSLQDLTAACEPYFEVHAVARDAFGAVAANGFTAWVVSLRRRTAARPD